MTEIALYQMVFSLLVLLLLVKPLGWHIAQVYQGCYCFLRPIERFLYWLCNGLVVILLCYPLAALADQANSNITWLERMGIDVSGYVDTSYNHLEQSNKFISGKNDREFDLLPNGFTLQQGSLTVAKQSSEGLGGLVNFILGRDANSLAPYGMNPNVGIQNVGFIVEQAYVQYVKNSMTFMGGNFDTFDGAESYRSPGQWNFSRSIIDFYAQPGTVLGLRMIDTVLPHLNINIGINNGWDNIRDFSRRKTIEIGFVYALDSQWYFSIQGMSGHERAEQFVSSGPVGTRHFLDIVIKHAVTDKLSLAANYDYVMQTKALWSSGRIARAHIQGIAGYLNYQWTDRVRTAFRAEWFYDQNGVSTGVRQNWREATLTLGYSPIKALEFRLEARRDTSNVGSFFDLNRVGAHYYQQSEAVEMVYQFA